MHFKIFTVGALVASVSAHMALSEPCPRFSPNCAKKYPLPAGISGYDYAIKNPIPYDGPLMKSTVPWPESATTWTAGQPVTVNFQPDGAAHGGGHCQFSLSYDGGKTSAVVHEVLRHCFFNGPSSSNTPEVLKYTFTLPADVPNSDSAVLSWTFVNSIGNREYYSNQASVKIVGSASKLYTGKQTVVANHNGYPEIPEFNGNYDTGIDLYLNAQNVTISPSGASTVTTADGEQRNQAVSSSDYLTATSSAISETAGYSLTQPEPYNSSVVSEASKITQTSENPEAVSFESSSEAEYCTDGTENVATENNNYSEIVSNSSSNSDEYCSDTEPVVAQNGNTCSDGQTMKCAANGTGFQQCVNGKWTAEQSCAPGTACKQIGGSIICDWA